MALAIYDPRSEKHVNVDASDVALWAALTQIQHSTEVIISCASHTD